MLTRNPFSKVKYGHYLHIIILVVFILVSKNTLCKPARFSMCVV